MLADANVIVPNTDKRRLNASQRPVGYYKAKDCFECGASFDPRAAGQRYCEQHKTAPGKIKPWERQNRALHLENRRLYMRRYRHAANFDEADIYERLVEESGEQCQICGYVPGPRESLRVDHCHASGYVRGLLCEPCNIGLGWYRDNADRLRSAADYIESGI